MYLVFPMCFSKIGLSERQHNRVKFYASSVAARLFCCVTFWGVFWTQMSGDVRQLSASGCPDLHFWHYDEVDPKFINYSGWVRGDCSRMPAFLLDACNRNQDLIEYPYEFGQYFSVQQYVSCLRDRSFFLQNICISEACMCEMLWDIRGTYNQRLARFHYQVMGEEWNDWNDWRDAKAESVFSMTQGWATSLKTLLYFPTISFVLWLVCSLSLHQLLGLAPDLSCYDGAFWMLGTAQQDPIMRDKIGHQSKQLAPQIAQKKVKPSCKQRLQLHLAFLLLLLDVVSDVNCLVQLLSSKQYEVAMIQACAIVLPILVDCYRSGGRSFQLVEVVKGFMASRKVGFPTDDYILALQSEKGLEAPLSFMIQYYTVFRLTSAVSFFSVLCSIPLSIYSMSKFVYEQFEFCILEAIEKRTEELNEDEEANSAKNQPSQPFFQGPFPQSFGRPKVLDTEWRQDPFEKPAPRFPCPARRLKLPRAFGTRDSVSAAEMG